MTGPLYVQPKVELIFTSDFGAGDPLTLGTSQIGVDFLVGSTAIADLTSDTLAIEIRRGRDRLLDTYNSGTAQVVIHDTTASLNPRRIEGPYYDSGLYPGRLLRITAPLDIQQVTLEDDTASEFDANQNSSGIAGLFSPTPSAYESLDVRMVFLSDPQWNDLEIATLAASVQEVKTNWLWNRDSANYMTWSVDIYGQTFTFTADEDIPSFRPGEAVGLRFLWTPDDYRCTFYYRITTPGLTPTLLDSDTGWIAVTSTMTTSGALTIQDAYTNASGIITDSTDTILMIGSESRYAYSDFGLTWYELGLTGGLLGVHVLDGVITLSRWDQSHLASLSTTSRTNYVTNPSFETGTTGWAFANCAGTNTSSYTALYGTNVLRMTRSTSGAMTATAQVTGLTASTMYAFTAYYAPGQSVTPSNITVTITFKDSGGGTVSTVTKTKTGLTADVWSEHTFDSSTPATAVSAQITISIAGTVAGDIYYIDGVSLSTAGYSGVYRNLGYFDGSLTHSSWTGTAHASTSIQSSQTWTCDEGIDYLAIGRNSDVESTTYDYYLYTGYITSFQYDWRPNVPGCFTTISAEDVFRQLNLATIETVAGTAIGDLPGDRITLILDSLGYPTATARILHGDTPLQDDDGTVRAALSACQLIEESELGAFYTDTRGRVVFEGRSDTVERISGAPLTVSDNQIGTYPSYQQITVAYDDELITNDARITPEGSTEQQATDVDSISRYFNRTYSKTGLIMDADSDALAMAQTIIAGRAEPYVRVESLGFDITNDATLWPQIVSLDINDPITVSKDWVQDPNLIIAGGITGLGALLGVQGISHSIRPDRWVTSVNTAEVLVTGFILDSSLWGELDNDVITY